MKSYAISENDYDAPNSPALRALLAFWFKPIDPTLLGVIRLCTGCVTLYVYLTYSLGLVGFVGPDAWVDAQAAHYLTHDFPFAAPPTSWQDPNWQPLDKGYHLASIYFHVTDPVWIWIIHLSILTFIFLFTIGFQTRVTNVLAWLGILCYIQRSLPTLFGMDTMNNLLLMYLIIGPSGAALSVDRWLAVRRLRAQGVTHIEPPEHSPWATLVLRLIQIHFCIIYLASGTSKLQGSSWWVGSALWGCFANFTFAPVSSGWYVELLKLLSANRLVWELVMTGGAIFTIGTEIGLPFCIWSRKLRCPAMLASILLHFGIGLIMSLTTFSMLMFCMVIAFTPPEYVRPFLESFRRRKEDALPPRTASPPHATKPSPLAAVR